MGFFDRIANLFGYVRAKPEDVVRFDVRNGAYAVQQMLYDNSIYRPKNSGGALEDVLKLYIGDAYCDVQRNRILSLFNPVAEIVDTYQHVMPGTWGEGVKLADKVDDRDVDQAIRAPIARLWRMSNLDTEKAKLLRWGANFGTLGIRVVGRRADGTKPARVSIVGEHASRIFNYEQDGEGNVTGVCLKYRKAINRGGTLEEPKWQTVDVVEIITKDEHSLTYGGVEQIEDADRANGLGFCPFVIWKFLDDGFEYGRHAYAGSEAALHRINWRLSRQDKSIDRHQFPKWFAAAGGDRPADDVQMGDEALTYVQTVEGTPPPTLQAIVPQIDQAAAREFVVLLYEQFRARQPELALADLKLLSNTSGESLEQSLKAVEKKILDARPGFLHAMTRAMQMGLSAGQAVGAWPVGGDEDYRSGRLNFDFAPMPALPLTTFQKTQQAAANVADSKAKLALAQQAKSVGVSQVGQLRLAGFTDEEIARNKRELAAQPTLDTEDEDVTA